MSNSIVQLKYIEFKKYNNSIMFDGEEIDNYQARKSLIVTSYFVANKVSDILSKALNVEPERVAAYIFGVHIIEHREKKGWGSRIVTKSSPDMFSWGPWIDFVRRSDQELNNNELIDNLLLYGGIIDFTEALNIIPGPTYFFQMWLESANKPRTYYTDSWDFPVILYDFDQQLTNGLYPLKL